MALSPMTPWKIFKVGVNVLGLIVLALALLGVLSYGEMLSAWVAIALVAFVGRLVHLARISER